MYAQQHSAASTEFPRLSSLPQPYETAFNSQGCLRLSKRCCCVQATGSVRFLQRDAIAQQLEQGHIVLLTSLAYSASGALRSADGTRTRCGCPCVDCSTTVGWRRVMWVSFKSQYGSQHAMAEWVHGQQMIHTACDYPTLHPPSSFTTCSADIVRRHLIIKSLPKFPLYPGNNSNVIVLLSITISCFAACCCCAGDVLNCNIYDVATHAAVELQSDKLIIMR